MFSPENIIEDIETAERAVVLDRYTLAAVQSQIAMAKSMVLILELLTEGRRELREVVAWAKQSIEDEMKEGQ